jgi:hypothetical protein
MLAIPAKEYLRSSLKNGIATAGNFHEEIVFHRKDEAFHVLISFCGIQQMEKQETDSD